MGFTNAKRMADAQDAGQYFYSSWRKQITQAYVAPVWFDMSMSPGNPPPNYYIGAQNTFTPLKHSTNNGLRHGQSVGSLGYTKYLRKFGIQSANVATAVPSTYKLLDYVGFYGFLDEADTDEVFMDNTIPFPRHVGGDGLQLMPVRVAPHSFLVATFTVNYTNSDGVAGRVTPAQLVGTQTLNGTCVASEGVFPSLGQNSGPFMALQAGDKGVQSVQSITMLAADVGLFALVVVKPLAQIGLFENTAHSEKDFLVDSMSMPVITDDAYLNMVCLPSGTMTNANFYGMIETTWG